MTYDDIRGIATLLAMIAFLGVVFWAWSSRRKESFHEAANQLFDEKEEEVHLQSVKKEAENNE
ncbi:MAG TPA: CcoQ/FixQ family Cbb3-type cytochrome c oxidase assembly chaperone [Gammaproteobacteria bacterium]|jgi:cytochrome c oxidase cbb3-type subunit 4|nr:CcoQ/FixQ family Cbb3-type cytochrome c oxidase assembly chaperone [Gammaproteobacteria bacterium]